MPRYQLEASSSLVAVGLCSLAYFAYSSRANKPKIQLPIYDDDDELGRHDPFDVVKPEDVIDGNPIDADAFWGEVRCLVSFSVFSFS